MVTATITFHICGKDHGYALIVMVNTPCNYDHDPFLPNLIDLTEIMVTFLLYVELSTLCGRKIIINAFTVIDYMRTPSFIFPFPFSPIGSS